MGRTSDQKRKLRLFEIEIACRVESLRKKKKWTQEKLASKLGVSRSSLANLESGRFGVHLYVLIELADALGTSVDYLLGRKKRP